MPYDKLREEKLSASVSVSFNVAYIRDTLMHVGEKNEGTSVHVKKLIDLCLRVGIFFSLLEQYFKHLQKEEKKIVCRPLKNISLLFIYLSCVRLSAKLESHSNIRSN